ncbi:hypothetical protein M153_230340002, partial [Pseudoloma neurophilia]
TFIPDLKRFHMEEMDEDIINLLKKRVYDMTVTIKNVKTVLNEKTIEIRGLKQYISLYLSDKHGQGLLSESEQGLLPENEQGLLSESEQGLLSESENGLLSESDKHGQGQRKSKSDKENKISKSDKENKISKMVYVESNNRWEFAILPSEDGVFQQISFVNSICTIKGGTHVQYVLDQIIEPVIEKLKKKEKGLNIKP